ncbi:glycosyltransferase [Luteolibacter sp. SL250]|uniref:glycosyltransferase n=1 Tax=Luteolibacter sp. SL250 TaxID=2995170 RepID=UPI00226F5B22|nr:glycosyltransferase [Luteolibacter sp. SL250]WAC20441.1 glycosyltransferase [Luteolibacter sp. SL250]
MKSLVIVSKGLAPYRTRFYSEVARCLGARGWRVALLTARLEARDHPWKDAGEGGQGLEIIHVGPDSDNSTLQRLVNKYGRLLTKSDPEIPSTALLKELVRLKPDCIWTHEYSPFCLAAAIWAGIRDIVCILSTDLGANPPPHSCTPLQLRMHRKLAFLYNGVIAQTREATRRWPETMMPVNFAPHAIDADGYSRSPRSPGDTIRFLFVAGIKQEKGIEQTIEAARILAKEGHHFELRVIGTGPLSQWLGEQKDPWLSIGGFIEGEALRKEYGNADIYVLPTEGDTYGVTVHEAAASSLPLIVGRNAGAAETLVAKGSSGFQIDHTDVPRLADRMRTLLQDKDQRDAMGAAARILAEQLDVKLLGARTASFIEALTGFGQTDAGEGAGDPEHPCEVSGERLPLRGENPRVAAVFATMNRSAVAAECFQRLTDQTLPPSKLFVTDNASTDDTCEMLKSVASNSTLPFELIRSEENLGNSGGVKLAVEKAFSQGYDAVWILDDDSWPQPAAFERLIDPDGPSEGIRTSVVLAPDSTELSWPSEVITIDGFWRNPVRFESLPMAPWVRTRRSWLGSLIPKDVYWDVGPLNHDFFLRGEDEDYPRALESAGYPFWMATGSILHHPVAGPLVSLALGENKLCLEKNLSGDKLYYRIRNMLWIKRKESGSVISSLLAIGYLLLIMRWLRPLIPSLGVFIEAVVHAYQNRLGKRPLRGNR